MAPTPLLLLVLLSLPLSMAPGDAVPALTMIRSVQPESYVTVRARTDSGPEDDKYSPTGPPRRHSQHLTVEAEASTKLCANLPGNLTMATPVTTELVMDRTMSGLTKVAGPRN